MYCNCEYIIEATTTNRGKIMNAFDMPIKDRFDVMTHVFYMMACDEFTVTEVIRIALELGLTIDEYDLFHCDFNIIKVYCAKSNHWYAINF